MGDYGDFITKADTKRFMGSAIKKEDRESIDEIIDIQVQRIVDKFMPIKHKILGLCEGNHEWEMRHRHSTNIVKRVCKELGVPFLGYSFFYRMVLKNTVGHTRNVIVYGHHGFGGGRTKGGTVNNIENLIKSYDADIYLMGHVHKKFGTRSIRLGMSERGKDKLHHKPMVVAATGTFMKTSVPGDLTYSEKFGYPPTDLGVVKIDITMKRDGEQRRVVDLHVSE